MIWFEILQGLANGANGAHIRVNTRRLGRLARISLCGSVLLRPVVLIMHFERRVTAK